MAEAQIGRTGSVWGEYSSLGAQSLRRVRLSCNPVDCSPPGSSVPGIPQARLLGPAAVSCSRGPY